MENTHKPGQYGREEVSVNLHEALWERMEPLRE